MLVKIITIMLRNTYTTDELVERIGIMRAYYDRVLFKEEKDLRIKDVVKEDAEEGVSERLEEWYSEMVSQKIPPLVVYEALDAILEDMSGLPTVALYVPVRFTPKHIMRFGEWFRKEVQPNILLSVRIDPRVTGGCGIVWQATYHDFSLRYYLSMHREEIMKLCNTYTHA
jgi:F0F1-type ATP synthase delta subunit